MSSDDRKVEMEKIQKMFKKAKEFGDEKVSIAIQTYEMVDKHIRRLDGDLAKFEAEMREKGRLSQTETEDEDDGMDEENGADDNGNKKTPSSVRGRKNKANEKQTTNSKKKKGPKVHLRIYHQFLMVYYTGSIKLFNSRNISINILGICSKRGERRFWNKKW